MTRSLALLFIASSLVACAPSFDDRTPLVSEPQILGVLAEPPEARPRAPVDLEAVIASPKDVDPPEDLAWAFCTTSPPLGDPRPIAAACRDEEGASPIPDSEGATRLRIMIPANACARFGPEPPPGESRPVDPDETGGFYQPVRIRAFGQTWLYRLRVRCGFPNAPTETVNEFAAKYTNNTTPLLETLERRPESADSEDDTWQDFESARPGETVRLRATWPEESAEEYVWLPPRSRTVTPRREALRIRWLATAGGFAVDASGRAEHDLETYAENTWTAPDESGAVTLWLVLTDSRGASSVFETAVSVEDD